MKMAVERMPAKKVRIWDMVNGKYFAGSKEELKPSYLITPFGQRVSRVNLFATVIDKFLSEDRNYITVTVDDGTEAIRVKSFKESVVLLEGIELGDMVLVIGKIKEYNNEVYINCEVAKKINDPNYETFVKLEILKKLIDDKKIVKELKNLANQVSEDELKSYAKERFNIDEQTLQIIMESRAEVDYKPKILQVIDELDDGNGVEIGKILELSNLPENVIERAIDELLSSGDLFEPHPGTLRRV